MNLLNKIVLVRKGVVNNENQKNYKQGTFGESSQDS